mmetsp:Transcript_4391/g.13088  ORF Transcript_4391/g.13088 Transcript_4391/m.13088 type:complete len:392 (+) Transcript_4391:1171-2346(+)
MSGRELRPTRPRLVAPRGSAPLAPPPPLLGAAPPSPPAPPPPPPRSASPVGALARSPGSLTWGAGTELDMSRGNCEELLICRASSDATTSLIMLTRRSGSLTMLLDRATVAAEPKMWLHSFMSARRALRAYLIPRDLWRTKCRLRTSSREDMQWPKVRAWARIADRGYTSLCGMRVSSSTKRMVHSVPFSVMDRRTPLLPVSRFTGPRFSVTVTSMPTRGRTTVSASRPRPVFLASGAESDTGTRKASASTLPGGEVLRVRSFARPPPPPVLPAPAAPLPPPPLLGTRAAISSLESSSIDWPSDASSRAASSFSVSWVPDDDVYTSMRMAMDPCQVRGMSRTKRATTGDGKKWATTDSASRLPEKMTREPPRWAGRSTGCHVSPSALQWSS